MGRVAKLCGKGKKKQNKNQTKPEPQTKTNEPKRKQKTPHEQTNKIPKTAPKKLILIVHSQEMKDFKGKWTRKEKNQGVWER